MRRRKKVALRSNDNSDGVADPFERSPRELEYSESVDWEGETVDPSPIGGIKIEACARRHDKREQCIDLDLRRSLSHDEDE